MNNISNNIKELSLKEKIIVSAIESIANSNISSVDYRDEYIIVNNSELIEPYLKYLSVLKLHNMYRLFKELNPQRLNSLHWNKVYRRIVKSTPSVTELSKEYAHRTAGYYLYFYSAIELEKQGAFTSDLFDFVLSVYVLDKSKATCYRGIKYSCQVKDILDYLYDKNQTKMLEILKSKEFKTFNANSRLSLFKHFITRGIYNKRIFRRMRSDPSESICASCLEHLFAYEHKFDNFEDIVMLFADVRYFKARAVLAKKCPKNILPFIIDLGKEYPGIEHLIKKRLNA